MVRQVGYYGVFDVQYSAAGGRVGVTADRALGDAILQAVARFRLIDEDRYTNQIAPRLLDGGPTIAKAEEPLVKLLDAAARDGRVVAKIRGQRVRFTPEAKRLYQLDRAGLTVRTLDEAGYQRSASDAIRGWYLDHLDRVLAEDPAYTPEARDRDRALAERPGAFRFDEPAGRPQPFTITPARPESIDYYRGRSFLSRDGERVPPEAISFHQLHFDAEAGGGQVLSALFAFDRRNGELLRLLELHD